MIQTGNEGEGSQQAEHEQLTHFLNACFMKSKHRKHVETVKRQLVEEGIDCDDMYNATERDLSETLVDVGVKPLCRMMIVGYLRQQPQSMIYKNLHQNSNTNTNTVVLSEQQNQQVTSLREKVAVASQNMLKIKRALQETEEAEQDTMQEIQRNYQRMQGALHKRQNAQVEATKKKKLHKVAKFEAQLNECQASHELAEQLQQEMMAILNDPECEIKRKQQMLDRFASKIKHSIRPEMESHFTTEIRLVTAPKIAYECNPKMVEQIAAESDVRLDGVFDSEVCLVSVVFHPHTHNQLRIEWQLEPPDKLLAIELQYTDAAAAVPTEEDLKSNDNANEALGNDGVDDNVYTEPEWRLFSRLSAHQTVVRFDHELQPKYEYAFRIRVTMSGDEFLYSQTKTARTINKNNSELVRLQSQFKSEVVNKEKMIRRLNAAKTELQTSHSDLRTRLKTAVANKQELERRFNETKHKLEIEAKQKEKLEQQLNATKNDLQNVQAQLKSQVDDNQEMVRRLNVAKTKLQISQSDLLNEMIRNSAWAQFSEGDEIDARDRWDKWYHAKIKKVKKPTDKLPKKTRLHEETQVREEVEYMAGIYVKYQGWQEQWDEWIFYDSSTFCLCQQICGTPKLGGHRLAARDTQTRYFEQARRPQRTSKKRWKFTRVR